MSEHFFYVAKKKHAGFFRSLVITNIVCTVLVVYLSNSYSYKAFLQEKLHVVQDFLGIPETTKENRIDTFESFHAFFVNSLAVGLLELKFHAKRICNECGQKADAKEVDRHGHQVR